MNGLQYLKQSKNPVLNKVGESMGIDLSKEEYSDEDIEKLKEKIDPVSSLLNFDDSQKEKIKNYANKIEKNPKVFEKDLERKLKSHNKKFENGNLEKGLLEGLVEIFLEKKPSKSKYTRKKKRK